MTFFLGVLQIHSDETNRGRTMSLFGLINRGLGPMGSFPFGVVATSMRPLDHIDLWGYSLSS